MFISVLFLPQRGLELREAIQRALEVFDDVRGENVRRGEIVQIGKGLVLDPENIKAGLVAGQNVFLNVKLPPAAVRIFL